MVELEEKYASPRKSCIVAGCTNSWDFGFIKGMSVKIFAYGSYEHFSVCFRILKN